MTQSPFAPEVPINLDTERILTFPLPAIFAIEDATGLDILGGGLTEQNMLGSNVRERMERIIVFCWAGLIAKYPKLTREEVARWIYIGNLPYVEGKVIEAFFASLPSPDEVSSESPLAPTAETPPS